ncbi:MAG TPA: hypothetical protein VNH11_19385 [Pirellulales bacterium]|nr:hypothetical protein [Pirellulales bacterium]
MQVLFYVSGHGYGHATRTSEILRSLVALRPDCTVHVRSNVPPHLFAGIERVRYHASHHSLDPGVVEEGDSLGVDVPATLNAVERYFRWRQQHIAEEVHWIAEHNIGLIVADFPPLAGEVAAACGLPSIGIGNFTWDWIYEPLVERAQHQHLLAWIREGYTKLHTWLRMPFSHADEHDLFRRIVDVPLVARRARREPEEVCERLGLARADGRRRAVLAMRGRIPPAARAAAAEANPDWLFLHFDDASAAPRANELAVTLTPDLLFTDVLSVCDVAVSKFGYGMVSECIAARKRLLCPPRRQFREDEVFARDAPKHLRLAPISRDDLLAGHWSDQLRWLADQPTVEPGLVIDGAEVCAREIATLL